MLVKKSAKKYVGILLILCGLALILSLTVVFLQAGYGYTGRQQSKPITLLASQCTSQYKDGKYKITLYKHILSSFICACLTAAFLIGLVVLILILVYGLYLTEQQSSDYLQPSITHLKIKIAYILISLCLFCNVINVGKLFGFLVEINQICRERQFKNEVIPMLIISGVALLLQLTAWVVLICMNSLIVKYLDDNQIIDKPLIVKDGEKKHQQPQYPQTIQMNKYKHQVTKSPRQNLLRRNEINTTEYPLNQPNTYKGTKQIKQIRQQNLLNPYYQSSLKKSPNRQNPLFKTEQKSPYQQILSKPVQLFSPSENQNGSKYEQRNKEKPKQGITAYYKPRRYEPYFESAQRSRYKEPQRIIPQNAREIDNNSPSRRLHSTYFRGEEGLKKEQNPNGSPSNPNNRQRKENPKTPQKKGMLMDYIRGKYVD